MAARELPRVLREEREVRYPSERATFVFLTVAVLLALAQALFAPGGLA